jgi:hypothetical protein
MRVSVVHLSLEVGYAWMLLNLALLVYVTVHFWVQRARFAWRQRRAEHSEPSAGPAPVVFISPR